MVWRRVWFLDGTVEGHDDVDFPSRIDRYVMHSEFVIFEDRGAPRTSGESHYKRVGSSSCRNWNYRGSITGLEGSCG